MISYGARLSDFKRSVIQYITDKTKEASYRNDPTLLRVYPCSISVPGIAGEMKLELCSIEKLCGIADKLHFKPIEHLTQRIEKAIKQQSSIAAINKPITNKTEDMAFEIKSNIPIPSAAQEKENLSPHPPAERKYFNYRSLPLKDMKVGDCIVIFNHCPEGELMKKVHRARQGVKSFVNLMDTKKKFYVDKVDEKTVGVWRLQ